MAVETLNNKRRKSKWSKGGNKVQGAQSPKVFDHVDIVYPFLMPTQELLNTTHQDHVIRTLILKPLRVASLASITSGLHTFVPLTFR